MDENDVYSYTKVKDICIGDITDIFLDKNRDVIIIHEDRGGSKGIVSHTFGTHAYEIKELVKAIQAYSQKRFEERQETFDKIFKAIAS